MKTDYTAGRRLLDFVFSLLPEMPEAKPLFPWSMSHQTQKCRHSWTQTPWLISARFLFSYSFESKVHICECMVSLIIQTFFKSHFYPQQITEVTKNLKIQMTRTESSNQEALFLFICDQEKQTLEHFVFPQWRGPEPGNNTHNLLFFLLYPFNFS